MVEISSDDLEAEVKAYRDKTGKDGELHVLKYIRNGWPVHLKSIEVQASAYFKVRSSLSEANG